MSQMPRRLPYMLQEADRNDPKVQSKIATCCYCGTRAALALKGRERHELACSNCGAPLHELKMLKAPEKPKVKRDRYVPTNERRKPKKQKKRGRSLSQRFLSEIWDVAEDIFDNIFD